MQADQLNDGLLNRLQSYDRALNAIDLAELLHVSKISVRRMCKANAVPFFKIGKLVRFHPRLIAEWLESKQRPALVPPPPLVEKRRAG
jgi:excisionase family DNA binding protein